MGERMSYETIGYHLLMDLFNCETTEYDDNVLEKIIELSRATPLKMIEHKFEPQGKTSCVILSESHLAIHTYPEHKYISLDIYTCGSHTCPNKSIDYIVEHFKPEDAIIQEIKRGV